VTSPSTKPPPSLASTRAALFWYIGLAYALSWLWLLPLASTGAVVVPGGGWPTHFPALLGPMIAAMLVAARAGELRDLLSRMVRVRVGVRWWLVAVSPLGLLVIGLLVTALAGGRLPGYPDFGVMSGLPSVWGPVLVAAVLVLVNGFGEETGWRGFALPALQRRLRPLPATLVVAVIWAGWHLPMFLVLAAFRGFGVATAVGWLLGLVAGSVVLGWMYDRTRSIAVVAVWHGLFNVVSGTAAGTGTTAAVVSAAVMVWAAVLVGAELTARRRGRPGVFGSASG
jgi:membrane protease YdiL (CAAX protease family)